MKYWRRRPAILALAMVLFAWVTPVKALPFEMIVPSEVNIDTFGGFGIAPTIWGLITPTSGTLTDADLSGAVLTVDISDPNVSTGIMNSNPQGTFSIAPGTFAGFIANFPGSNNTAFSTLLSGGESVGAFWMYQIGFSYAQSYTGSGTLNATFDIGGEQIAWSSQVNFLNSGPNFEVVSAQRLHSTPEPGTGLLLGVGCAALARLGRTQRPGFSRSRNSTYK